jgi:hypothetical protein
LSITEGRRERWHKCDTKSLPKTLYGRLKSDIHKELYFPDKFAGKQDITLRTWIAQCIESSTNRTRASEEVYGRRCCLLLGGRLLPDLSAEDLRRLQARMRAR